MQKRRHGGGKVGARAGRGGEEGQEGAVELKGKSGAEIGRGRVPRSGHKRAHNGKGPRTKAGRATALSLVRHRSVGLALPPFGDG